ncbi:MAG: tetratricopeptide repeat protein [Chitinophagales bacterium]
MKSVLIAVALAILCVAVLFFGFTNKPPKKSVFDLRREKLVDSLHYPNGELLISMHDDMLRSSAGSKTTLLKQLSEDWLNLAQPAISANYLLLLADNEPTYENYMVAGQSLANLIDFEKDENLRVNVVYGARYAFEQAEKLKPGDMDAKIGLATVLVSGTNSPMEGIMMLREIDASNPDNIKVNLELGRFSVMSGQYDKALERFERVLQKDSLNLQARYMMAQTFLGMHDTSTAIIELEKLKSFTTDKTITDQVDMQIRNLNH